MYSKIAILFALPIALISLVPVGISQQAPAPPPQAAAPTTATQGTFRGRITDPSGALMPGVQITISNPNGQTVGSTTSDAGGNYEVNSVAPGTYTVTATSGGFAPFVSTGIPMTTGQAKRVDISMAIDTTQQNVVVTDETPTVSVEADNNADAMVLKGKDLDALSDDPDELSDELSALAGPSAGPNGGQIYIDGFTGGQLPPKSSIREIRVNQNPYSAEFDRLGFGRIEILTKPGTDKLHGQFTSTGNDNAFNTGNPYVPNIPAYYSYQMNGNVTGSLSKNASFFISIEHRNINQVSLYDVPCTADGSCDVTATDFTGTVPNPHTRTNFSPRFDFQFGAKNTLTMRYQYYHDSESGEIGTTSLPSTSDSVTTNDNSIQISDTEVINDKVVNETRLQYDRQISSTTPVSGAPAFSIPQELTGGGSATQFARKHEDRWEMQNLTTMALGRHAVKFGMRVRDTRDANFSDAAFNGDFQFPDTTALNAALTKPISAQPTQLTYTTGKEGVLANVFDGAVFLQDDWKINPRLTLSGGIRWESQNHVSDHDDWAPRFSFAWAADGANGKQAKTVIRGGYGIFYDRFQISNLFDVYSSTIQDQYTLSNPVNANGGVCFNASVFDPEYCAAGEASSDDSTPVNTGKNTDVLSPTYHSPYAQQFGLGVERQLTKKETFTINYLHSSGVHQLTQINANAPYSPTYDKNLNNLIEFYPEGHYHQDQLILSTNARISNNFNFTAFYNLSYGHTDGAGGTAASNSLNLKQDYGQAAFISRNSLIMIGNYAAPWNIKINPFIFMGSGKPFNIITGSDRNGDTFINDRPFVAPASDCSGLAKNSTNAAGFTETAYGCLDATSAGLDGGNAPPAGEKLLPYDAGHGPDNLSFNLRVSRSFGVGPRIGEAAKGAEQPGQNGGPPPGSGGGPGGGPGGGGGGGRGGGGPGGPGGGPPGGGGNTAATGRKYSLNFSAQAQNLFNDINRNTPVGKVGSRLGESTGINVFGGGVAARIIRLGATFSF